MDGQGRPRVAFYSSQYPDPAFQPDRLYSLWCNTTCTDSANHDWQIHDLALSAHDGKNVDLALIVTQAVDILAVY
jgi:hypothetical protein